MTEQRYNSSRFISHTMTRFLATWDRCQHRNLVIKRSKYTDVSTARRLYQKSNSLVIRNTGSQSGVPRKLIHMSSVSEVSQTGFSCSVKALGRGKRTPCISRKTDRAQQECQQNISHHPAGLPFVQLRPVCFSSVVYCDTGLNAQQEEYPYSTG